MTVPATGQRFSVTHAVTQDQINAYAAASGDHNPLHTDPAFAATTPLGGTVAHGMLVLAWLSSLLSAAFATDWASHGSLRVRFRTPARPGDVLAVSATVRTAQDTPEGPQVALDLLVANQRQEAVIDGQGAVLLASLRDNGA